MRWTMAVLLGFAALLAGGFFLRNFLVPPAGSPSPKTEKEIKEQTLDVEVLADNLKIPWGVAFVSNSEQEISSENDILLTERPGNLLKIGKDKQVIKIEGVAHVGEGGLLGVAIHPDFKENNWIYLYLTARVGESLANRVERYRLEGSTLTERRVIITGIAGSEFHDGGRIAFGPDGYLYITTGDAGRSENAQDKNLLNGKILRLDSDGGIPSDNPFGNPVFALGLRNPQGLAWDKERRLWATDHGRSGLASGLDELNLIEKGQNFGWPIIQGEEGREGMVTPVIQSGTDVTWAPSGAAYFDGSIFFGGLRGEALFEYNIAQRSLKKHFEGEFGRLRTVVLGPDNFLYITTSNTDGRGIKGSGDDKLVKINPQVFR